MQIKNTLTQPSNRFNFAKTSFFLYLPFDWNIITFCPFPRNISSLTTTRLFFFYSRTYYIFFSHQINFIPFFCNKTKTLRLELHRSHNYYNVFKQLVYLISSSFSLNFFTKLKFKGKGYYIFKNKRNTITFRFGYSHRIYLYAHIVLIKFLSKTAIFIFGLNKLDILTTGHALINVRPFNIFTNKGVRFAKQIIYKKIGKVGSYR